jgi:hypothetical protein
MTQLTRAEQEAGAAVIRTWTPATRRAVVALPARERDIVVLAAGVFKMKPVEDSDD